MTPDLLIAGHIAKDITADGWRPGGGVLYAAAQASGLGLKVAAVTACEAEVMTPDLMAGVEWRVLPSEATTTFENVYHDGVRQQRLLMLAREISLADVPSDWLDAPLVLLAPLFHEIEAGMAQALKGRGAIVGLGAQGWLRRLEGDRVCPEEFSVAPEWLAGEVVFVSEEDLLQPDEAAAWRARVPVVALTRGRDGCSVWDAGGRHDLSSAPVQEIDPTGAGDVFAAAFLVRYGRDRDAVEAARFAAAAAALAVQGEGVNAVAGRDEIEALLGRGEVRVA